MMAIEGLLHHFGVRTEAHEQELRQWLVESQAAYADLVKDVHELWQFIIVKLASCMIRLDLLDRDMQSYHTEATQTSTIFQALEDRVAIIKDFMANVRLQELRTELQVTNEEIATIWEK